MDTKGKKATPEMTGHKSQDIEIPLDLIEELTSQRISPFKEASSTGKTDILVVQHDNMATTRLPSLSTTPTGGFIGLTHPHAHTEGSLTSRSQFKHYKDTRVPYSVLRGYVFGNRPSTNRSPVMLSGAYKHNVLPSRELRHNKDKDKHNRSRSECTARHKDIKIPKPTLRMLALENKVLTNLPKIPREFCFVHTAGTDCTCAKFTPTPRSHSNESAVRGVSQLRDRLRFAASRLSNQNMFENTCTDRQKVRRDVIKGLKHKPVKKDKNITSNERVCKYMKGQCAIVKSYPPTERTSSRNYINTWLQAGAEVPCFVKDKPTKE